jgi:urease
MGEANGSIPTVQPVYGRPMWGAHAGSAALNSVAFVSGVSVESGAYAAYGLRKRAEPVAKCRDLRKKDMKWNDAVPKMSVDAESYEVRANEEIMDIEAATELPLTRGYNFF